MATTEEPSFRELLKRYRRAAGLTQEVLAERSGLSVRGIQDLERGASRAPRPDTIELLAAALEISPAERSAFVAAARRRSLSQPSFAPASPRTASLYPLVGRRRELALLEEFLAGEGDLLENEPFLVLTGEPGIGKTRLLEAAAQRAVERDWCVLMGGCQRVGGQEPYAPLQEALARYLHGQIPTRLEGVLAGCAWLVHLLPEFADALEPVSIGSLSPEQERRLLFVAVERFLSNVAGSAGTLLVLDDLQWAGADALDLLGTLVRSAGSGHPSRPPLRVVGAYRDSELHPADPLGILLADLAQAGLVRQHPLGPLHREEAETLFHHLLVGLDPEQGDAVERALDRGGGMPFFLVSYAHALRSGGQDAVPWDVMQGVRQRVALLPEASQKVLGAVAIIGRRSWWPLLPAVAGQVDEDAAAGLEAACQARLLLEDGAEGYVFAHDVIREVVEADLGTARRILLHRRAAEALEALAGGASPEVLAYHYARSGITDKAAVYLERAGDAARARYAHTSAAEHFQSAVARLASDADRARVGLKLGAVLTAAGNYDEAVVALERAAMHYRAVDDRDGEARSIALLGEVHFRRGTVPEGLVTVKATLESLPAPAPSGAAHLYVALARLGPRGEMLAMAQRAIDLARLAKDDRILATAKALIGHGLLLNHRPQEAVAHYEQLLPRYEATGDLASLCLGLTGCAHAYAALGAFADAKAALEQALLVAERIDDQSLIAEVLELRGWHSLTMGDWQATDRYVVRLEDLVRSLGTHHTPVPLLLLRFSLALQRGQWEDAIRYCEEAERIATRARVPLRRAVEDKLATCDLVTGHPEAALLRLERLDDQRDRDAAWARLVDLAEAHLGVGNVDRAEEIAAEALAHFGAREHRLLQAEMLRVHGMILVQRGRREEAEKALAESISLAHSFPYPYLEARSLYALGMVVSGHGDLEGASGWLHAALTIFQRLGAARDSERAESALAALRLDPTRPEVEPLGISSTTNPVSPPIGPLVERS